MTLTVLLAGVVWALGAALFSWYVSGLENTAHVCAIDLQRAGDAKGYVSGMCVWYSLYMARKHAWAWPVLLIVGLVEYWGE